jgi:hypothetical protein
MKTIPIADLRERLEYSAETGLLRWLVDIPLVHVRAGDVAGCIGSDRYVRINWRSSVFRGHRLAWALHFGEWPQGIVDHRNGCRSDNRISNLRVVDSATNAQNMRSANVDSRTGFLGVTEVRKGKFRAKLKADGRYVHVGTFPTAEEAHAAYIEAKRRKHAGCTL